MARAITPVQHENRRSSRLTIPNQAMTWGSQYFGMNSKLNRAKGRHRPPVADSITDCLRQVRIVDRAMATRIKLVLRYG
jgi:hypothetical protein